MPLHESLGESNVTVLIVEDHEPARYVRAHALATAGFRVLQTASGEEALRMVWEHRPTVVVLDVVLPDMDGITVCRAIKENPATANTMVLQTSAYYVTTEAQIIGLDSGADAYIPGDIAPELLTASVRALVRTCRAEEAVREQNERLLLIEALHRSDEKLRALTAHLFTIHEEERAHIAREVHDDLSQRLAVVDFELNNLRQRSAELDRALDPIISQITALSQELRTLSHALHPSGLEHVGLDVCLRNLCGDFEQRYNLPVLYVSSVADRHIPPAMRITFYRIAQEALRNVAKHAGDARATVTFSENGQKLFLTIHDDGCGFDLAAKADSAGLGLISMQERARLVKGQLDLQSSAEQGTTIKVSAPLDQ
jgi:signal transduction histidine kinase